MRNFNEDDFNNEFGDDFFGRWERFNERMKNDRDFRREINRFQKDFEEMMRMMSKNKKNGINLFGLNDDMKFISLNDFRTNNFDGMDIPEDEMDIEKGEDENGEWEKRNWTSPDGSVSYTSFTRSSGIEDFGDKIFDRDKSRNIFDPEKEKYLKLAKLKKALDYCVEQEKYEKAAELKKEIDKITASLKKKEE